MTFFRKSTDGRRTAISLENSFSGPFPTACWIMGGGPSLRTLPIQEIARTPVPKFAVNLAGSGLLRPTFWTSYDPTERFHRSVYLDPGITKFVHECRSMDLVPETTCKVCECPAVCFFERNRDRGYQDFPSRDGGITDWQDSLIQAIDISYRLGFRELYLAGCEMFIPPSMELLELAESRNVAYQPLELLGDFLKRCRTAGLTESAMEQAGTAAQYHFTESKPLRAAVQTDFHYFRVAQYLRLSRRSLALAGLKLVSVTPGSRLNGDFPCEPADAVCERLLGQYGDPARESTLGRYSAPQQRRPEGASFMRDFRPHFWPAKTQSPVEGPEPSRPVRRPAVERLAERLPEIPVDLDEVG